MGLLKRVFSSFFRVEDNGNNNVSGQIKLRALEFIPLSVITIDRNGNVVDWNLEAELTFGFTSKEMLGNSLLLIIPEKFRAAHLAGLKRAKTGNEKIINKTINLEGLRKDGEIFPIQLKISKWEFDDKFYYTGYIKDLTIK